jgi:23S rRNA (uracil1939-C5)-methyltransferase
MKKRGNSNYRNNSAAPVKRTLNTEPLTLEIQGYTHDLKGVSRFNDKAVFVEGALLGEQIIAKASRETSRFISADIVEITQPSDNRIEAQCPHYGRCGGCNLWHMKAEQQIVAKQQVLADQLGRQNIEVSQWLPALTGPLKGYRRRARLGIRYRAEKNQVLLGFRERANKHLADIDGCLVLEPVLDALILPFKALLQTLEAKGALTQLELYLADNGPLMALRHVKPLSANDIKALKVFAQEHAVAIYGFDGEIYQTLSQTEDNETALKHVYQVEGLDIRFQAGDFLQVNREVNQKMLTLALDLLNLKSTDKVLDLFSGLGNFSLPMAAKAHSVVGVEVSDVMTQRALQNAQNNQLDNVTFKRADLSLGLNIKGKFDVLVLDPPRAGASEVVKSIKKLAVKRILYVSCDPATLARDAKVLVDQGYIMTRAGVMDMFPQTAHVESIALFEKV